MRYSISLLLIYFSLLVSCKSNDVERYYIYDGTTQGTTFHIVYSVKDSINYTKQIDSILKVVDFHYSVYDSTSILSRINRNSYHDTLDYDFIKLFQLAKDVHEQSNGAFDPTIAPLINFWGFGPNKKTKVDTSHLHDLLKICGFQKASLSNKKLLKQDSLLQLNFNAIAQGHAVDILSDFFESEKIQNYLVEIGGEVRVMGVNNKGSRWRIGIDKPSETNLLAGSQLEAVVSLNNIAVSTSGNYRNYYVDNGVVYAHTINPHTGYPAKNNMLSATVFSKSCAIADAYATAFMVMGAENAIQLAKKQNMEVYFIYTNLEGKYTVYMTEYVKGIIEKINEK